MLLLLRILLLGVVSHAQKGERLTHAHARLLLLAAAACCAALVYMVARSITRITIESSMFVVL